MNSKWKSVVEQEKDGVHWTEYTDHDGKISILFNLRPEPGFKTEIQITEDRNKYLEDYEQKTIF